MSLIAQLAKLQLAVLGSGISTILTSVPGIPILALERLSNAAAYRKHCDKTDSSPEMTVYTEKEWSRI